MNVFDISEFKGKLWADLKLDNYDGISSGMIYLNNI